MDTLHLNPRLRIKMPEFLRWVVVGLSFLLAMATWWVSDLWRLATWSTHQIEMDGAMPRRALAAITGFAVAMVLCEVAVTWVSIAHGARFVEWIMPTFVFGFLYSVASFIRLVR